MSFDESFVTATASLIFFALAFKYFKSSIGNMVNNRIKNITNKFDEVLKIKNDSELLLKEQQEIYATLEKKNKEITQSAELEIAALKTKAESDLVFQLNNQTNNLQRKINDQEQKALTEMRVDAVKIAISNCIKILNSDQKTTILSKLNLTSLNNMSH